MVSVLTWNCAGNVPASTEYDIRDVILTENMDKSDVYIVGLQEMVPLNTKEIMTGKDKQRTAMWQAII